MAQELNDSSSTEVELKEEDWLPLQKQIFEFLQEETNGLWTSGNPDLDYLNDISKQMAIHHKKIVLAKHLKNENMLINYRESLKMLNDELSSEVHGAKYRFGKNGADIVTKLFNWTGKVLLMSTYGKT